MLRYWYQCTVYLTLCVGQKDISALQLCSVKGLLLVFHMVLLLAFCFLLAAPGPNSGRFLYTSQHVAARSFGGLGGEKSDGRSTKDFEH